MNDGKKFMANAAHRVTAYMRRHTSENNLNQFDVLSDQIKQKKSSRSLLQKTMATSTDDLSHRLASKTNFTSQSHLSTVDNRILSSTSIGASASLIDLTAIGQVPTKRPLFRFVPSGSNIDEIEPKTNSEQSHMKIHSWNSSNHTENTMTHALNIVKPKVIMPVVNPFVIQSTPINRYSENQFYHENERSAFKPLASHRTSLSTGNESTTDMITRQRSEPVGMRLSGIHVGLTNPHAVTGPVQYRQTKAQHHRSMFDLSLSDNIATSIEKPARASYLAVACDMIEPVKHSHYIRHIHQNSRPMRYPHSTGQSLSSMSTEPVNRCVQQMHDSTTRPTSLYSLSNSSLNTDDKQRSQVHTSNSYVHTGASRLISVH
jgi:hypothetical protein